MKDQFTVKSLGFGHDFPHEFVTSQWDFQHVIYIVWRGFWCLWHIAWMIRGIQLEVSKEDYPGEALKYFIYLTNWSYVLLVFQSSVHFIVVLYHTNKGETDKGSFSDGTKWHHKLLWLLTNVSFDAAIVVTILYWALVFKELDYALSVMTHAVNTLYVVSDIFLVASPVRLLHFLYACIYAAVYGFFSLFYHLGDGTNSDSEPYIYSSLDWSKPGSTAGLVIGVVVVAVPLVHLLQFALYTLRLYIRDNCSCCGGGRQSKEENGSASTRSGKVTDNQVNVEMREDISVKF